MNTQARDGQADAGESFFMTQNDPDDLTDSTNTEPTITYADAPNPTATTTTTTTPHTVERKAPPTDASNSATTPTPAARGGAASEPQATSAEASEASRGADGTEGAGEGAMVHTTDEVVDEVVDDGASTGTTTMDLVLLDDVMQASVHLQEQVQLHMAARRVECRTTRKCDSITSGMQRFRPTPMDAEELKHVELHGQGLFPELERNYFNQGAFDAFLESLREAQVERIAEETEEDVAVADAATGSVAGQRTLTDRAGEENGHHTPVTPHNAHSTQDRDKYGNYVPAAAAQGQGSLMTGEQARQRTNELGGHKCVSIKRHHGQPLGFQFISDTRGFGAVVSHVNPGGLSDHVLTVGDRIILINDTDVSRAPHNEILRELTRPMTSRFEAIELTLESLESLPADLAPTSSHAKVRPKSGIKLPSA